MSLIILDVILVLSMLNLSYVVDRLPVLLVIMLICIFTS